jgi:sulfur-oxidizing protein SoxX
MHKTAAAVLAISALGILLVTPVFIPATHAAGEMPDKKTCETNKNPVVSGGCLATDKAKGNCMACHKFDGLEPAGLEAGNIGPPLVAMKVRFPDKKQLREQLWDATTLNPSSSMPPYGKYDILTDKEIDLLVEWLYSL